MNAADAQWMERALVLAERAAQEDEVPVGAVLVADGKVVGEGGDRRVALADPTAHAEILAMRAAARAAGDWRLEGTTLYVTLEPCPMCAGAILQARIARVVYGAPNLKSGAAGTLTDLFGAAHWNHTVEIVGGVLADRCAAVLQEYFRRKRSD